MVGEQCESPAEQVGVEMFHCPYGYLHFEEEGRIVLFEGLQFAASAGNSDMFANCICLGQDGADPAGMIWCSGGGVDNNRIWLVSMGIPHDWFAHQYGFKFLEGLERFLRLGSFFPFGVLVSQFGERGRYHGTVSNMSPKEVA